MERRVVHLKKIGLSYHVTYLIDRSVIAQLSLEGWTRSAREILFFLDVRCAHSSLFIPLLLFSLGSRILSPRTGVARLTDTHSLHKQELSHQRRNTKQHIQHK